MYLNLATLMNLALLGLLNPLGSGMDYTIIISL